MKKFFDPESTEWNSILERPTQTVEDIEKVVEQIFGEVKEQGDEAVKKYSKLFDGNISPNLKVSETEISNALLQVPAELKAAIDLATENIRKFHAAQITERVAVETVDGVNCWQEKRPIQKVGLYIPGGTAPLFSTILMLAVPAQIAGCKEVSLCTPPAKDGSINPVILYTAKLCGIEKIYKVGGIQAVAAMTFGTESIGKVFKIFGPGNQYVTVAKQLATKFNVAIDMPAGPSELLVVADETADAAFVASDLLSQAEHGADSQVVLVSLSRQLLEEVEKEIASQIEELPRKEIAKAAIEHSRFIYMSSAEKALELIDEYAPEHFIICTENSDFFVEGINNAGSVFIGNYTPESAGDYASGTNHTLPTNGYAKQYSGVNLDSFTKAITFQKISAEGIKKIGNSIELMAEAEGLQAHKNAVTLRLNKLKTSGNE
ncbi:histidinol dehydrogenase [Salinimicrobium sediminilitoris]|uniref:histidinol dehydrogenase n=1 Tax=Salinimicrobium sediminilitoris TaxID=2876715 RepID=UPI001E3166CC|nr:histidinol dehydrogenase [Salinimicrobium sediminilitoris]MCC8360287.1 histidinol dehydrogenase [Salinimicrobium sediminilitoris]